MLHLLPPILLKPDRGGDRGPSAARKPNGIDVEFEWKSDGGKMEFEWFAAVAKIKSVPRT